MLRSSQFHPQVCGVCTEICLRRAADCEAFGDDEQMSRCAQACRERAQVCQQMAGVPA